MDLSFVNIKLTSHLLKSAFLFLPQGSVIYIIYFTHREKDNYKNSYYKCALRVDTLDNWKKLQKSIAEHNPAEYFKLNMLGIPDDYVLTSSNTPYSKALFAKHMGLKFSENPRKYKDVQAFIQSEIENPNAKTPYLRVYNFKDSNIDISDYDKFIPGVWYIANKEIKTRGRKKGFKVIY